MDINSEEINPKPDIKIQLKIDKIQPPGGLLRPLKKSTFPFNARPNVK